MGYEEAYRRTMACAGLTKTAEKPNYTLEDAAHRMVDDPISTIPLIGTIRDLSHKDKDALPTIGGSLAGQIPQSAIQGAMLASGANRNPLAALGGTVGGIGINKLIRNYIQGTSHAKNYPDEDNPYKTRG